MLSPDLSDILYGDETDGFWGDGADCKGKNELGNLKALVIVSI
jgi:predicted NAD-dependent protein-ADP-ribosyltransferase YbiA (DUF1768 family)